MFNKKKCSKKKYNKWKEKKKVKKRENQPTIDPFSPGLGGLVGGERANYLRKKGSYYIFSIFFSTKIENSREAKNKIKEKLYN